MQHQLDLKESSIIDIYKHLEQKIYLDFIKRLQVHGIKGYDQSSILQWQMQVMNDLHLVNGDVVQSVSQATGIAKTQLQDLFLRAGHQVVDQEYATAINATKKAPSRVKVNMTKQILDGYLKQTFLDLDNNVNQTLITTNYGENAAMRTYQQIIKETTADVLAGIKTPEKALRETIYKWRHDGIKLNLTDKGGHPWSLEGYTRLVIGTTTRRAFQEARDQVATDMGVDTFVMSSHPASRPACAPIQGKLITTRHESFTAETGEHFESIWDHGYGEPDGCFGINCHHLKWMFIPGVNTNNQEQCDPLQAVMRGGVVQKQRVLERRIRKYKDEAEVAITLHDAEGEQKYNLLVRKNQSAIRQLVKENDFLVRDYDRERSYTDKAGIGEKATLRETQIKKNYANTTKILGKHAPTYEEYRVTLADSEKMKLLRNQIRYINDIHTSTREGATFSQRVIAEDALYAFQRDGIIMSGHAALQFAARMRRKNGTFKFNYSIVSAAMKKRPNFTDPERVTPLGVKVPAREIHYYGRIGLVTEISGEIVTLVYTRRPPRRWIPIEKK
ncbi:phage minor capsid protein [Lacticaseibacillus rhamnosus]|nr:phage minor capsid protein [Lacticaseibacillus rhamnosus]